MSGDALGPPGLIEAAAGAPPAPSGRGARHAGRFGLAMPAGRAPADAAPAAGPRRHAGADPTADEAAGGQPAKQQAAASGPAGAGGPLPLPILADLPAREDPAPAPAAPDADNVEPSLGRPAGDGGSPSSGQDAPGVGGTAPTEPAPARLAEAGGRPRGSGGAAASLGSEAAGAVSGPAGAKPAQARDAGEGPVPPAVPAAVAQPTARPDRAERRPVSGAGAEPAGMAGPRGGAGRARAEAPPPAERAGAPETGAMRPADLSIRLDSAGRQLSLGVRDAALAGRLVATADQLRGELAAIGTELDSIEVAGLGREAAGGAGAGTAEAGSAGATARVEAPEPAAEPARAADRAEGLPGDRESAGMQMADARAGEPGRGDDGAPDRQLAGGAAGGGREGRGGEPPPQGSRPDVLLLTLPAGSAPLAGPGAAAARAPVPGVRTGPRRIDIHV